MKTMGKRFRVTVLTGAAVSVLAFAAAVKAQGPNGGYWWSNPTPSDKPWADHNSQRAAPVLAVVGDISCQPGEEASGESSKETCTDPKAPYTSTSLYQSQEATANQIEALKPDAVALLGDLQY